MISKLKKNLDSFLIIVYRSPLLTGRLISRKSHLLACRLVRLTKSRRHNKTRKCKYKTSRINLNRIMEKIKRVERGPKKLKTAKRYGLGQDVNW